MWVVAFAVLVWMGFTPNAFAECIVSTDTPTYINGKRVDNQCDENGRLKTITDLASTLAGEDVLNDVQRAESQFGYETVAASQTDQVMGTTGAAGDLLHAVHCVWTAAPAAVTSIKDGAGAAINIFEVKGAAGSQTVILDLVSADGGWKLTTSTNMTCIGIGRFS